MRYQEEGSLTDNVSALDGEKALLEEGLFSKSRRVEDHLEAGTVVDEVKEDEAGAHPARIRDTTGADNASCKGGAARRLAAVCMCSGNFRGTEVVEGASVVRILRGFSLCGRGDAGCLEAKPAACLESRSQSMQGAPVLLEEPCSAVHVQGAEGPRGHVHLGIAPKGIVPRVI